MPSALSYPGVYIEEVPSGVHAIVGVSTSIAAFLGRTVKGPIDRAVRVTDRAAFIREFGGPHPNNDLAASFNQFFDNGGTDCYIVRVAHNAQASDLTLRDASAANDVLVVTARDKGAWGDTLRLEVDYATANADETFNLHVIEVEGDRVVSREDHSALSMNPDAPRFAPDFISQSSRLVKVTLPGGFDPVTATAAAVGYSEARRPIDTSPGGATTFADLVNEIVTPAAAPPNGRFEIAIDDGAFTAVNIAGAPFVGGQAAIATEIGNRIRSQLPPGVDVAVTWEVVHNTVRVLRIASAAGRKTSVRVRPSGAEDFASRMMLGVGQGGVEVSRFSGLRPVPTATYVSGDLNTLGALQQDAFDRITVDGINVDLIENGTPILQTTGASERWYKDAVPAGISPNGNNDGVREKLMLLAGAINRSTPPPDGVRTFRAEVWGNYRLAIIPTTGNLNRKVPVVTSSIAGGGTNVATSFTTNTRRYALGNAGASGFQSGAGTNGRDDDGSPPDISDYIGNPATGSGMHALDTADLFNLMILPGDSDVGEQTILQLAGPASIYCASRRAFLLVDAPSSWTNPETLRPTATPNDVDRLRQVITRQNAAVYYPHIVYNAAGRKRKIGASGAVAGVMARIDVTRGVWKAPAGTEADVRGILDLDVNLSDREHGILNKAGANALRIFPVGIVVWGARTLAGTDDDPNEWKYVPIRRFALFLEESLFRGTKWIVFEPNDEPLWANIRKNIRAFMLGLFRQGAFEGNTPDKAFYVKCDAETTTPTDRNLGIVNIEVGFAPLKPAEFVVIKIQQIAEETP